MPQTIDYAALAEQARKQTAAPVDYDALAQQARGVSSKRVRLQDQQPDTSLVGKGLRAVGELEEGVLKAVNPVTLVKGLAETARHPVQAFQQGVFPTRIAQEAIAKAKEGDYLTAARKGLWYAIPLLGPAIDAATDRMMAGQQSIPETLGEVGASTYMALSPMAPKGTRPIVTKPPLMASSLNPVEAAAVKFGTEAGVPMDLATKTGNPYVANLQKNVSETIGGADIAKKMKDAQSAEMARVGMEQATKAGPVATNPVAAGEGIQGAFTKQIESLHQKASTAYEVIRQAEEQATLKSTPKNMRLDVAVRTPLAVDLTAAVKQLQPLYTQLKRESELGIPMQGARGRTLAALDGLMNAPNFAPLTVVDAALSDLKAMARGADMPELRTPGQASAAQAVQALDAQVRATAAKAGPNILKALEEGRAATRQKYAIADVLDLISAEPGQVFRQLTQAKDVGLERLRAVQRVAPKEVQNISRAYLEDALSQATERGGFEHADRLYANWQKLGSETKKILFPKEGQIAALDNYFLSAKKLGENPNPSGTARVMNATNLLIGGIPARMMAKMLYTPEGVRYLTAARIAVKSPSRVAQTLAATQLAKAAQASGVPLEMIPVFASEPATPEGRPKQ